MGGFIFRLPHIPPVPMLRNVNGTYARPATAPSRTRFLGGIRSWLLAPIPELPVLASYPRRG
jgi:hypothetical protein